MRQIRTGCPHLQMTRTDQVGVYVPYLYSENTPVQPLVEMRQRSPRLRPSSPANSRASGRRTTQGRLRSGEVANATAVPPLASSIAMTGANLRRLLHEHEWELVGLAAVTAFALGLWGYAELDDRSVRDDIYRSLQLFVLEAGSELSEPPLQLEDCPLPRAGSRGLCARARRPPRPPRAGPGAGASAAPRPRDRCRERSGRRSRSSGRSRRTEVVWRPSPTPPRMRGNKRWRRLARSPCPA